MLVNNRALGAHWSTQSAPVTSRCIESECIVVEQPRLLRAYLYTGSATCLLHQGMDAVLTLNIWDNKLALCPLDDLIQGSHGVLGKNKADLGRRSALGPL